MSTSQIFAGFLADLVRPGNTLFLSFFLGGLSQILIWSLATGMGPVMLFAVIDGFAGSWFLSLVPPVVAQMFGTEDFATLLASWCSQIRQAGCFHH